MDILKYLNLAIRFVIEIISLISIGYWAFQWQGSTIFRYGAGIGTPLIIMIIWGAFGSPAAPYRLELVYRLLLQLIIFGLATAAIYFSSSHTLAIVFAVIATISTALFFVWKQQP